MKCVQQWQRFASHRALAGWSTISQQGSGGAYCASKNFFNATKLLRKICQMNSLKRRGILAMLLNLRLWCTNMKRFWLDRRTNVSSCGRNSRKSWCNWRVQRGKLSVSADKMFSRNAFYCIRNSVNNVAVF
eukprot:symbB.v1.2.007579.t1/scaffold386.1/size215569/5